MTGALLAVGMTFVASAAPAVASTSGSETFNGTIVTSGVSRVRTVVNSVVVAHGVFKGAGRIVEVDNLPGDPDEVSRDDLVFPGGSIRLISTTIDTTFSVNPPHLCRQGRATATRADRWWHWPLHQCQWLFIRQGPCIGGSGPKS
jgi:hypothetical protein